MKQLTSKEDKKNSRETLNSLCSVSALLLSVACCMALIHVELRIQEHHRLISHSVTVCDQMETQILRKVQQNYERWQVTRVDGIKGHLQGTNGKEKFYNTIQYNTIRVYCENTLSYNNGVLSQTEPKSGSVKARQLIYRYSTNTIKLRVKKLAVEYSITGYN